MSKEGNRSTGGRWQGDVSCDLHLRCKVLFTIFQTRVSFSDDKGWLSLSSASAVLSSWKEEGEAEGFGRQTSAFLPHLRAAAETRLWASWACRGFPIVVGSVRSFEDGNETSTWQGPAGETASQSDC